MARAGARPLDPGPLRGAGRVGRGAGARAPEGPSAAVRGLDDARRSHWLARVSRRPGGDVLRAGHAAGARVEARWPRPARASVVSWCRGVLVDLASGAQTLP